MKRSSWWNWLRVAVVVMLAAGQTSCSSPQVYGSIGVSSYGGGYGHGPRVGGSISMGGRIYP